MSKKYPVVYWDAAKSYSNPEGVQQLKTFQVDDVEAGRAWLRRIAATCNAAFITEILETYTKELVKKGVSSE